jgi:hypothetical protein
LEIRRLRSALSLSVPLCLGIMASISSRAAIPSAGVLASLKRFSASKYAGGRLAGNFSSTIGVMSESRSLRADPCVISADQYLYGRRNYRRR